MAKNADFIKDPESAKGFTFTAASDLNAGEIALVEDTYVMAYVDVDSGDDATGIHKCNYAEVPKATGTGYTFAAGDILWLDTTALTVHATYATGDVYVGTAREAATAAATHVLADWDGRKRA